MSVNDTRGHFPGSNGIVGTPDEMVGSGLVPDHPHLGVDVVLHLVVIPVEMVGGDIHKYCYLSPEVIHSVELEAAEFNHIVIISALCHCHCETVPHIAGHGYVEPGLLHHVIDQVRGGGLAVASRHAYLDGICVTAGKLDLGNHRDALFTYGHNKWIILVQAGTLDHLAGVHNQLRGVLPLFKSDVVGDQYLTVLVLYRAAVAHENVKSLLLSQHSRSRTALSRTQYYNSFVHSVLSSVLPRLVHSQPYLQCPPAWFVFYLVFSVTTLITASMIATIQKRVTIFGSAYPFF